MQSSFGVFFAALFLLCQLFSSLALAQSEGFDEPVRVSQKLMNKRIPGVPYAHVSDVLRVLYPKLVPVHDDHTGQGSLVVDVQSVRGPFVYVGSQGLRPSPAAIAVLIIEEQSFAEDGSEVELIPKLAVLESRYGKLKPLATLELADFKVSIEPEHDGGSGLKLTSWDVHPSAKGVVVTVLRSEAGPDMNNASAELCLYFIAEGGELSEVYQTDVLDQTDETTDEMTYSEIMRVKTIVDKSSLINGLRVLNVENYSSRTEDGRLRHVEIDYQRMCWNGDSFDEECDSLTGPLERPIGPPVLRKTPRSRSIQVLK